MSKCGDGIGDGVFDRLLVLSNGSLLLEQNAVSVLLLCLFQCLATTDKLLPYRLLEMSYLLSFAGKMHVVTLGQCS